MGHVEWTPRRKRSITASLVGAVLALLGAKKTFDYAAPPTNEKSCDYVQPQLTAARNMAVSALPAAPPSFIRLGGTTVDASCLNKSAIFGVAKITSAEDVGETLRYAKEHGLNVTSAGRQHSMGGQSFSRGGIVIDMKGLNNMTLDKDAYVLRVESGATWAKVQEFLDKEGLSVKAMQSINIFTVGGTLSVNAHGVAHNPGQVAPTVRSLRIMLADGTVVTASRTENETLFRHTLGGYGLFGIILEAELDVVPNEVYAWSRHAMDYAEFPKFYADRVRDNAELGLMYGRLSVADSDYLRGTTVHLYTKTPWTKPIPMLKPESLTWVNRLIINFSKTGSVGRWVRTTLEKHLEPRVHACVSRNQAMGADIMCDVARNQEMYDAMGYLKNRLPDTDILQEYFIPADHMTTFIDGLRDTVRANEANLLNITVRFVHEDTTTALPYAKGDRFAFVLYFNQKFNDEESEILRKTTVDLINLAIANEGTFYLPYQLHYSDTQLRAAYPEIDAFFDAKKSFDPNELFVNEWYLKYGTS